VVQGLPDPDICPVFSSRQCCGPGPGLLYFGQPDPDPHQSGKQDPDPHQCESKTLEGHFGALEGGRFWSIRGSKSRKSEW
jgi:hypothetical protein